MARVEVDRRSISSAVAIAILVATVFPAIGAPASGDLGRTLFAFLHPDWRGILVHWGVLFGKTVLPTTTVAVYVDGAAAGLAAFGVAALGGSTVRGRTIALAAIVGWTIANALLFLVSPFY